MKIDTMAPLVDVHPIYEALAEFKDGRDLYDRATKSFLRSKLKKAIQTLRETADHLEEELKGSK